MNELVLTLNQSFYNLSFLSLAASLLWGILSVFLSPCHVASIPLVIGYINNREKADTKKSFHLSLLFGLGILSMLILMGIVTGLLGRILGDVGTPVIIAVYLFLLFCGFWLLDLPIMRNWTLNIFQQKPKMMEMGAFSLGFIFGLILGPCSFAFLAPMIGIVFAQSTDDLWFGIALFILYGIGHTAAIVAAGTLGSRAVEWIETGGAVKASLWIKRLCGLFIMGYSIYKIIEIWN